jgi:hypothetical protein
MNGRLINTVAKMMDAFVKGDRVILCPANVKPIVGHMVSVLREDGSGLSYVVTLRNKNGTHSDVYVRFME